MGMGRNGLWESHGNGNRLQNWEWEWEGMGIDCTGMGGSGNVKSHSRASLLWTSGLLNDVFVSGLPGLVGLSVHSLWSRSLQYARALVCRSCAYARCFMFPECFSDKCPVLPFCSLSSKIPLLSSVNHIFELV